MREQDLRTLLDAGDLTGNHQTLVGFAASAMGMKAQGVPIADTVSMAKQHGGRIRLDWSPRRWREEHYGNIPTFFRLLQGLSSLEKIGFQLNHDCVGSIQLKKERHHSPFSFGISCLNTTAPQIPSPCNPEVVVRKLKLEIYFK